jgi:hypothetical protein
MTSALDSLVGELHISGGARQSTNPATRVLTAARRAARGRVDDTLYVLVDLNGAASSGLLAEIIERLAHAYWSTPGSVTSALRAGFNAAAEWLMDRNTNSPVSDRQTGGVSCAVLRGSKVYLAQAGPSNAYVTHRGAIEQYPARDAEPVTPLGMARANEIRYALAELQPGDMLILTDARAPSRIPIEAVASAIVGVGIQQALANLGRLAGRDDLIALAVEAAAVPEETAPAPVPTPAPSKPDETIEPSVIVRPPVAADRAAARPATRVNRATEPRARATTTPAGPPRERPRETARAWLTALVQSMRRSAGSVGTAGQMVMQRTLPDSAAVQPRRKKTPARWESNTPLMAGLAIGIPVIVSLIAATIYIQGSTQAELETRLATAQNEITLAGQTVGSGARAHWQAALDQAGQALILAPDDTTALNQLAQAQAAIDQLDNVVRLKPTQLWDFKSIGQHRLALQGFSLFVLDRATDQIDRLTLNAAGDGLEGNGPEHILSQGMTIGNRVPGNLLDMTWMNSSDTRQTSSLIVMDQGGLIEYNLAFGLRSLDFGTNTVPAALRRLRSYIGNLYVLDPASSQVLRYEPKGDGYAGAPVNYFEQPAPEAARAIDMAIDGSIYLVTSDGQITKYLGGKPDTFQITDLPVPLGRPAAAAVDTNVTDSSLYVADQTSSRIVQFRPDGKFVRQFRALGPAFDGIEDLLIDEQNNRVFVVSKGVLYTASLPPVQ